MEPARVAEGEEGKSLAFDFHHGDIDIAIQPDQFRIDQLPFRLQRDIPRIFEQRARAAEMRRMAETATTERIRAALRRLADRFERLADDHGRDQHRTRNEGDQQRRIKLIGPDLFFIDIPEIGIVKPKQHRDIDKGSGSIDQAHLPKLGRPSEFSGQVGGQQLNHEFGDDRAHAIPNRFTR